VNRTEVTKTVFGSRVLTKSMNWSGGRSPLPGGPLSPAVIGVETSVMSAAVEIANMTLFIEKSLPLRDNRNPVLKPLTTTALPCQAVRSEIYHATLGCAICRPLMATVLDRLNRESH
jgi:hypothetical protein